MSDPKIYATYKIDYLANNPGGWDENYDFNTHVDTIAVGTDANGQAAWYLLDKDTQAYSKIGDTFLRDVNIDTTPYPEFLPSAQEVINRGGVIEAEPGNYGVHFGLGIYEEWRTMWDAYDQAYDIDPSMDPERGAERQSVSADLNFDGIDDAIVLRKGLRAQINLHPNSCGNEAAFD